MSESGVELILKNEKTLLEETYDLTYDLRQEFYEGKIFVDYLLNDHLVNISLVYMNFILTQFEEDVMHHIPISHTFIKIRISTSIKSCLGLTTYHYLKLYKMSWVESSPIFIHNKYIIIQGKNSNICPFILKHRKII